MNTFQHQRVYDPNNKTVVHLTNMASEKEEDYLYVGSPIAQGFAEGIATGDLHPATKEKMQVRVCVHLIIVVSKIGLSVGCDCITAVESLWSNV